MIPALQSALSAIQAYGTRLEANGNNVANSATPEFKGTRVTLSSMEPYGVKAVADKTEHDGPMIYDRTANGLELVEQSNVELARELPEMMLNAHYFKANLVTIQNTEDLLNSVLDLKA